MVKQTDMVSEWILYWLENQNEIRPTRDILDRFDDVKDSRMRSKLQQLRNSGLVKIEKKKEYGHNLNATNYHETTQLFEEYGEQYDLSIPNYVLRERLNDWQEFYDEYLKTCQARVRDLESQNKAQAQRIRQLEQEKKKLRDRVERLEQEVFDDSEETAGEDANQEGEIMNEI